MVDVFTIPISKVQFDTLPKDERATIFVAGHVLNQISVFMKLVHLSSSHDPANPVEEKASGMQTQIILRSLMGALAEATVWFGKRQKLIELYLPDMHQEGRDAYDKVKAHFPKNSFMRWLRNNFLYHYPNEENADIAFKAIPETEPWEWYLSQTNTNSIYFSSELVLGYGLMTATGEPTPHGAFGVVMARTMELANTMPDFLMRLIETILTKKLGPDILKPRAKTVITETARFGEFWLPFYVAQEK